MSMWQRLKHIFTVPWSTHWQHVSGFWEPFLLRLSLALDDFTQAWFPKGVIGVTVSSRIGLAAAHGHLWGIIGWWMLDVCWPFRKDPVTGQSHCAGAWVSDCVRAREAIAKIEGDPVVMAYKWPGVKLALQEWKKSRRL